MMNTNYIWFRKSGNSEKIGSHADQKQEINCLGYIRISVSCCQKRAALTLNDIYTFCNSDNLVHNQQKHKSPQ